MNVDQRNHWMLIARCLQLASPNNVLIEIGAFNGDDTKRLFTMARKPVRQFAFEPDPRNLQRLRTAKLPAGVEVIAAAVGSADGREKFHLSSGGECSSSLRTPKEHVTIWPNIKFENSCDVDVVTLDAFCAARGITGIDFMWIDAQGAERDIVAGGGRVLAESRFVFLERADHELYEGQWRTPDMIEGMGKIGWACEALFENDALFYNKRFYPTSPFGQNNA